MPFAAFEQEPSSISTDKKINAGKISDTSRYKNSNNFKQFSSENLCDGFSSTVLEFLSTLKVFDQTIGSVNVLSLTWY